MSTKNNICPGCKKTFKTTSILNQHIKTSKTCAKIRGENPKTYKCCFCDKPFTTNNNRKKHAKTCEFLSTYVSETLTKQITEMKDEIARCHKKIEDLELKYSGSQKVLSPKVLSPKVSLEKAEFYNKDGSPITNATQIELVRKIRDFDENKIVEEDYSDDENTYRFYDRIHEKRVVKDVSDEFLTKNEKQVVIEDEKDDISQDYYQTLDDILSFNKSYEHPENPSRKRMEKDLPYMKLLSEKLQKKSRQTT